MSHGKWVNGYNPDVQACCNCVYWRDRNDGKGDCRRRSPAPADVYPREYRQFPVVHSGDWCGDFDMGKRC